MEEPKHLDLNIRAACDVLGVLQDGRFVLTCSTDGKMAACNLRAEPPARIWRRDVGELTAAALSPDGAWLAKGHESDGCFGVWVSPMDAKKGPLPSSSRIARFTLPVRHLTWHPQKPILGIAADDGLFVLWDREKKTRQDVKFPIEGGLRFATFNPVEELVAIAGCSGALAIMSLQGGEKKQIHRSIVWPKSKPEDEPVRMAWHPDGKSLAVPGAQTGPQAIRIFRCGAYASAAPAHLLENAHAHDTTAVAWSVDGAMLASMSSDTVAVWQPPLLLQKCALQHPPRSVVWSPSGLVVGTTSGCCAWLRLKGAPELSPTAEAPPDGDKREEGTQAAESQSQDATHSQQQTQQVEEQQATQQRATRQQATQQQATQSQASQQTPQEPSQPASQLPRQATALPEDSAPVQKDNAAQLPADKASAALLTQPAFQPCATQNAKFRYLACNEHGVLKHVVGREDRSGRSARKFSNGRVSVNYMARSSVMRDQQAPELLAMGTIGPTACALATEACGMKPAKVMLELAKPWKRSSFEVAFEPGEHIEALAIGRAFFAALVSPQRTLRIFSLHGLPLGAIAVCGAPVCLVGSEDLLLCITAIPGDGGGGSPLLEYALYGVKDRERLAKGPLPLSPGSTLRWAGFSSELMPLALDSKGTVRALGLAGGAPSLAANAGGWIPILQLEKSGARLWPVRSASGELCCADMQRDWDEPHPADILKLRKIRLDIPLGDEGELQKGWMRNSFLSSHLSFVLRCGLVPTAQQKHIKEAEGNRHKALCGQALRMFETLMKAGDVHQAADAVTLFMSSLADSSRSKRLLFLLKEALGKAEAVGEGRLAQHVAAALEEVKKMLPVAGEPQDAADMQEGSRAPHAGERRSHDVAMGPDSVAPPAQRLRLS